MRSLRIFNGKTVKVQFQLEPRHLMVGAFWRWTAIALHVYVCLIPGVPLHITILRTANIGWKARSTQ